MRRGAPAAFGLSALFLSAFLSARLSEAQTSYSDGDASITLERTGCLGTCPDYKVTVLGNGWVKYVGRDFVRRKGVRSGTVPVPAVQKLVQRLRDEDFFHWEEKEQVCIDFPEVHITVILNGLQKHVLEGCDSPGKLLALADEIDRVSGAKRWVGRSR